MSQQSQLTALLDQAGVTVNGSNPWDPQVSNPNLWNRLFAEGTLGLGEAYMDGWWDVEDMAEFFSRVISAQVEHQLRITPKLIWQYVQSRFLNMQTIKRSQRVAKMHYNETAAY